MTAGIFWLAGMDTVSLVATLWTASLPRQRPVQYHHTCSTSESSQTPHTPAQAGSCHCLALLSARVKHIMPLAAGMHEVLIEYHGQGHASDISYHLS